MPTKPMPLAERFWKNVDVRGPDECWEYGKKARGPKGHGMFQRGRGLGTIGSHRMAWILTHGELKPGEWVLHRCDNPPCCNPEHLYVGDHEQNMRDMGERKRSRSAKVTHCPSGHPYSEENTYVAPKSGERICRTCRKAQKRARYLDPTKSR